jgi:hypothetical protein
MAVALCLEPDDLVLGIFGFVLLKSHRLPHYRVGHYSLRVQVDVFAVEPLFGKLFQGARCMLLKIQ